jgi:hypothetical protein
MESTVKRRYSDFEWLRSELERENKTLVLLVPGKAFFFFLVKFLLEEMTKYLRTFLLKKGSKR